MPLLKGKATIRRQQKVVQLPLQLREEPKGNNPDGRPRLDNCNREHNDWKFLPCGQRYCRVCHAQRLKEYASEHKEKIAAYNKKWRAENRAYLKASNQEWRQKTALERKQKQSEHWANNRDRLSIDRLCRRYGITPERYLEMVRRQDNKCAICNQRETATWKGRIKALAVDHDHETGEVRALLCADCNVAIGSFQEDTERMASAIRYLRSFKSKSDEAVG